MNRAQLQQLAEERVRDAQALLDAGQWSGAYYLAGYAVECGVKACIAKRVNQYDFPDKDLAFKSYTHKIHELIKVAGLGNQLETDMEANPDLEAAWAIVKDWDEKARYEQWTESKAREFFAAVSDADNGVLRWIRDRW